MIQVWRKIGAAKPLTHFASVVELREMLTVIALRRTRRTIPTFKKVGSFLFG